MIYNVIISADETHQSLCLEEIDDNGNFSTVLTLSDEELIDCIGIVNPNDLINSCLQLKKNCEVKFNKTMSRKVPFL